MALEVSYWDPVDRLTTPQAIIGYLEAAFEDGDPALIAAVIQDVARAKGLPAPAQLDLSDDIRMLALSLRSLGLELSAKAA